MHIFLTGEIQIGKSTVLQKTLALLGVPYGGFRTYFGPDRYEPSHDLYINAAAQPKVFAPENAVARFRADSRPEAFAERFDMLGASYIKEAAARARLIVMDECGTLESQALIFQHRILDALDRDVPVLGVVKLAARGWADRIRRHPKVKLITVDTLNRDRLPEEIAGRLFR